MLGALERGRHELEARPKRGRTPAGNLAGVRTIAIGT